MPKLRDKTMMNTVLFVLVAIVISLQATEGAPVAMVRQLAGRRCRSDAWAMLL